MTALPARTRLCLGVLLVLSVTSGAQAQRRCDEPAQQSMQEEFNNCVSKFMQKHREAKSSTKSEIQRAACQMLKDTVECGNLWSHCQSESEVRAQKDMHISARIQQFQDNPDDIDVKQCSVVREYLESGRANKRTEEKRCSAEQVTSAQSQYQSCSQNLTDDAWYQIKDMEDAKRMRLRKQNPDIDYEENILNMQAEIQPLICLTLYEIGVECAYFFDECFNQMDRDQMLEQSNNVLKNYLVTIYKGLDLSTCALDHSPVSWAPTVPSTSTARSTSSSTSTTSSSSTTSTTSTSTSTTTPEPMEDDYSSFGEDYGGYDATNYPGGLDYAGETNDITGPVGLSQTSTTAAPTSRESSNPSGSTSNYQAGERISSGCANHASLTGAGLLTLVALARGWAM